MRHFPIPALVAVLGLAGPAWSAPAPPATVAGVVVDTTGAPIPGALVMLRLRLGTLRARSDAAGRFAFAATSATEVTVSYPQFAPARVDLEGSRTDLRITLEPRGVSE